MSFTDAFSVLASGLDAQRARLAVVSSNLANVQTTRTPEGGPYRRRDVVFTATPVAPRFESELAARLNEVNHGVEVSGVVTDPRPLKTLYEPGHPDADENGYVRYPNVNPMEEMVNMMSALRSYEANVTAVNATKSMALKALEIGR
jgi:flagellar basal-body rod protein FlgC